MNANMTKTIKETELEKFIKKIISESNKELKISTTDLRKISKEYKHSCSKNTFTP